MLSHSIQFSSPSHSLKEILQRIWPRLTQLGIKSGGSYILHYRTRDRKELKLVTIREGLSGIPHITEDPTSFNEASVSFWLDTMEFLLTLDTLFEPPALSFTFMGNALKNPGQETLIQVMLAIVTALNLDCAVLLSDGPEEQDMEHRILSGESVLQVVQERLTSLLGLGPLSLALIREDVVSNLMRKQARDLGLRTSHIFGGYIIFSSLQDAT